MTILITNIQNSLIEDALKITNAEKAIIITEDLHQEYQNSLISDQTLQDISLKQNHVTLDDLVSASRKLEHIIQEAFDESSNVYFALEGNAMGWQILEVAKEFNLKKVYVVQNGTLSDFKVCFVKTNEDN